jgi:hypothetical protein
MILFGVIWGQGLAIRRGSVRMGAASTHATALAVAASKSLRRRRQRPSQVRAAIQPRSRTSKPAVFSERLMISNVREPSFQGIAQPVPGVTAGGGDVAQPGIERADRSENARRAAAVLNVSFMHAGAGEVAWRAGDDMTLAPFDLVAGAERALPCRIGRKAPSAMAAAGNPWRP